MPSIYPSKQKISQLNLKNLKPEDKKNIKGISYVVD
jgi:hypothetical protein